MRGNANASALNGSSNGGKSSLKISPVRQILQAKINVRMVNDRSKTGRQTVASNASVSAMLNDTISDNEVIENAFAKNAKSVDARQSSETSVSHGLEL